jgi:heavy metal translocating P-type ATPase
LSEARVAARTTTSAPARLEGTKFHASSRAEGHEVVLDIQGMTCASCVTRIERVLTGDPSVLSAMVNLATRSAIIHTAEGDPVPLIEAVTRAGYGAALHREASEDRAESKAYTRRLAVAAFFTFYVLCFSFFLGSHSALGRVLIWLFATPVQFYGGWPFILAALRSAKHRVYTMDTLISVGSLAAYSYSVIALLSGHHDIYFDTSTVIVTLVLAGKVMESATRARAGDAARLLLRRGAAGATVLRDDGRTQRVAVDQVRTGDTMVVLPGEKVPADGTVRGGRSAVDLSMLTGESVPVDVQPGDQVFAPSLNGEGRLEIEVTAVGTETRLAQIVRLLETTQASRAPIQRLADRVAARFVPVIFSVAAVTLLAWQTLGTGGLGVAMMHATAVLLIACPCALGLATPAAIMAGSGRAAELGILFKGGEVFEAARAVDTVLLDKTGTLTLGSMALRGVVAAPGVDPNELLSLAAAAERGSEHPIARAVVDGALARGLAVPAASGFVVTPGAGVRATVDGREVRVARPDGLPDDLNDRAESLAAAGLTTFGVWVDDLPLGLLGTADQLKEDAEETVAWMRDFGFEVALVTGDRRTAAEAMARDAGIVRLIAETTPEGKVEEIRRLQAQGRRVAFVGDGLNDGPALAQADLGVALGTGTDVAIEAADVKIMGGDLRSVANALFLARWTYSVIGQNLAWAFAYNLVMVPLAMLGILNPLLAAGAMAASSVTVVGNALRLRRYAPGRRRESSQDGPDPLAALIGVRPEEIHGSQLNPAWW